MRQIEVVQPQVLVTLGRIATDFVLDHFGAATDKIGALHGQEIPVQAAYGQVTVVPMFHPAAAFYARDRRETMAEDFEVLK